MEMIIGMIKIMTVNDALCEYRIILNVLIVCLFFMKSRFKNLFRNAIRAPNSLDPDQVPYFVGPGLGPKMFAKLKISREELNLTI